MGQLLKLGLVDGFRSFASLLETDLDWGGIGVQGHCVMLQLVVLVKQYLLCSFLCCSGGITLGSLGLQTETTGFGGSNDFGLVFDLAM